MIIDTHAQIFTKELIELSSKGEIEGLDTMGYSFFFAKGQPDDTLTDMDKAQVDMSVVVAVDAETTTGFKIPNDLVAEAVSKYPDRLIGFAGVDPHKGKLAVKEVERAIGELGLKGLKFIPQLMEMEPSDQRMYAIYEAAQQLDVPILFHTGTHFHIGRKIKYCMPYFLDEVAVDFPSLKIVIAHFGFPWFAEAIAVVQRNPNVYFNIAGWAPRYIPDMVVTYMDGPLSRKALFGSDHPLLARARILEELKTLDLKETTLKRLLEDNPRVLLGLD